MSAPRLKDGLLPGLPVDLIRKCFAKAPGNELESDRFVSPESSAALAANAFGYFLDKPGLMPALPVEMELGRPPVRVDLEFENRFPWSGGRHSWLDALVETASSTIGVESKRYEPFRAKKKPELSDAYWRPVWGDRMTGYCRVRDGLGSGEFSFERLDAAQLVKHAFGLRTTVHRDGSTHGKQPVLLYLYSEPERWPDGRTVDPQKIEAHREEIARFAKLIEGDEVRFLSLTYKELLASWGNSADEGLRVHAKAVRTVFKP